MGNKKYDQYMNALIAAINKAQQPSEYEMALQKDWQQTRDWLNKKDYRNLPTGINVDLLPLADYQRMQSYGRNPIDTGAANQMGMANARELSNNQLARDWGRAYEEKVGGLMDRNNALVSGLQGIHTNRMNVGITGAQGILNAYNQRPKGFNWADVLGSSIGAAGNIISALI